MEEVAYQTAEKFFIQAQSVLIALPAEATVDAIAAGLALDAFLTRQERQVVVAFTGVFPGRLQFLPNSSKAGSVSMSSGQLVLSLDTAHAELGELSYETLPGRVEIYLKAKNGRFTEHDIQIKQGAFPFDLLVTIGAENPEQLGATFTENTDLFYGVPRVNIDISPVNENYGTVNLVDVTRSSVSELVYKLLSRLSEDALPVAATPLLAGVLANTDSLKNQRTTPEAFAVAADLAAAGARYTEVVTHLFKTEQLSFLKLWGRSLARLKTVQSRGIGYSVLLQSDFEKTGEPVSSAPGILAELRGAVGDLPAIFLAVPAPRGSVVLGIVDGGEVSVSSLRESLHGSVFRQFKLDQGTGAFEFFIPTPIESVENLLSTAFQSKAE